MLIAAPAQITIEIGLGFWAQFTVPEGIAHCAAQTERLNLKRAQAAEAAGRAAARVKVIATGLDDLRRELAGEARAALTGGVSKQQGAAK